MKKLLILAIVFFTILSLVNCSGSRVRGINEQSIVISVDADYRFKKPYFVVTDGFNFVTKTEYQVGDTVKITR